MKKSESPPGGHIWVRTPLHEALHEDVCALRRSSVAAAVTVLRACVLAVHVPRVTECGPDPGKLTQHSLLCPSTDWFREARGRGCV